MLSRSEPFSAPSKACAATALVAAVLTCFLVSAFQPQPALPRFTDIAPRSRITYITRNSLSARKYFMQPMAGGVAIFDFDNDGRMDIFFTNGAKLPELKKTGPPFYNCLLRNKGDGTFEDVTAKAGLRGEDLGYNSRRRGGRLRQRRLRGSVHLRRRAATRSITTTAMARSPMSPHIPASARSRRGR